MTRIFDISVLDVKKNRDTYTLVDVREPHELQGEDGYIEEALLAPLGSGFLSFLRDAKPELTYVFICRSGHRSAQACVFAHQHGLTAYNMTGGMQAWRKQ